MLKDLPQSLLQSSLKIVENSDVLESCTHCGAVLGSCPHSDGLAEDTLSAQDTPTEEEPEAQLSGKKEQVVVNPEYKTALSRRPR